MANFTILKNVSTIVVASEQLVIELFEEYLLPFQDNNTKRPTQSQQIKHLVINNRIQEARSTLILIFHLRKWVGTYRQSSENDYLYSEYAGEIILST